MSSEWRSWQSWDSCIPSVTAKDAKEEPANWRPRTRGRTDIGDNSYHRRWERGLGLRTREWVESPHKKQVPSLSHADSWLHLSYPGRERRFYSVEKSEPERLQPGILGTAKIRVECHNERKDIKEESEKWDSRAHGTCFLECLWSGGGKLFRYWKRD